MKKVKSDDKIAIKRELDVKKKVDILMKEF